MLRSRNNNISKRPIGTVTSTSRLPWTTLFLLGGILYYFVILGRSINTTTRLNNNYDVTTNGAILGESPLLLPPPVPSSEPGMTVTATTDTAATNINTNIQQSTETVVDFERQEGVVLAVKIHGITKKNQLIMLKQSLCLLRAAYNHPSSVEKTHQ